MAMTGLAETSGSVNMDSFSLQIGSLIRLEQDQPNSRRRGDTAANEQPFGIVTGRTSDEFRDLGFKRVLCPESINEGDDPARKQCDADDSFHRMGCFTDLGKFFKQ